MTVTRHTGLLLIGAGVGLYIAGFLVPPDPVDEDYEARTMRRLGVKVLGITEESVIEQATEENIGRRKTRTAHKLGNWGFGFLVVGVGVMVLAGVVHHYRENGPGSTNAGKAMERATRERKTDRASFPKG